MGQIAPGATAMARNTLSTRLRTGSPNEMLLAPSVTLTTMSDRTDLIASKAIKRSASESHCLTAVTSDECRRIQADLQLGSSLPTMDM